MLYLSRCSTACGFIDDKSRRFKAETMADFEKLKEIISGEVITSKESAFKEELSKVWNGKLWRSNPMIFVKVKTVRDVSETLAFCASNKVESFFFEGLTISFFFFFCKQLLFRFLLKVKR